MTPDRRYSEAETRAVFARAAREQQAADEAGASGEGLALAELQEIGRASGLDPAFVAAAAAGIATREPVPVKMLFGVPLEIRRSRILPGPITDDAWTESVTALRALCNGILGVAGQVGRVRDWTSTSNGSVSSAVVVTATPLLDGRTEVVITQMGWESRPLLAVCITAMLACITAIGLIIDLTIGPTGEMWPTIVFWGTLTLAAGFGATVGTRAFARRINARIDVALDRIKAAARISAAPERLAAPAVVSTEARLDLPLLDEAPDAEPLPPRTRTR